MTPRVHEPSVRFRGVARIDQYSRLVPDLLEIPFACLSHFKGRRRWLDVSREALPTAAKYPPRNRNPTRIRIGRTMNMPTPILTPSQTLLRACTSGGDTGPPAACGAPAGFPVVKSMWQYRQTFAASLIVSAQYGH